MADVSFHEEYAPRATGQEQSTGLSGFLIARGFARTQKEAAGILLGALVVLLAIIAGVWLFSGSETELPPPQVVSGAPIF